MKQTVGVIFFSLFTFCMIVVVLHLFPVGDPHLPSYADFVSPQMPAQEVPRRADSVALRYARRAGLDVGATSVVGAVILDYRGYDTLYETAVLFTAVVAVLSVLAKAKKHD